MIDKKTQGEIKGDREKPIDVFKLSELKNGKLFEMGSVALDCIYYESKIDFRSVYHSCYFTSKSHTQRKVEIQQFYQVHMYI